MIDEIKIIDPAEVKNRQYYLISLILLTANFIHHSLFDCRTLRLFSVKEIEK
jgi:hypothetical protein